MMDPRETELAENIGRALRGDAITFIVCGSGGVDHEALGLASMIAESDARHTKEQVDHELDRDAAERLTGRCDLCQDDDTISTSLIIEGGLAVCSACAPGACENE